MYKVSIKMIYVGVDTLANYRPFSYVALDEHCRAVALGQGKQEEVLAYIAGQSSARVAVNGPSRPNQGLLAKEEIDRALLPDLPPGQHTNLRKAEYELLQRGIHTPRTAAVEKDCPPWMRRSFSIYAFLKQIGYRDYPETGERQFLEVPADASFWILIDKQPYEAGSLEGRLQRQMVLYQQNLPVTDPMDFFEEITPRKLLTGALPLDKVMSQYELNAWLAAYIAWLSDCHPERVSCAGAPEEGVLTLPVHSA